MLVSQTTSVVGCPLDPVQLVGGMTSSVFLVHVLLRVKDYNNNNTRLTSIFLNNGISRYQNATILDFISAEVMEEVVTTGAIKCEKFQSNRHHLQTNNLTFCRSDAFPVGQLTVSEH